LKTQINHPVPSEKPFHDSWFVSTPLRLIKGADNIQDEVLTDEELACVEGNASDYHHFYLDMGWLGLGAYT